MHNAVTFETAADVGDTYTPAVRGAAEALSIVGVKLQATGPLRATFRLLLRSSGRREQIRLRALLSLDAESDVVRVDIRGDNQRQDHRLRLVFHTDVTVADGTAPRVWADAAFGPVARPPLSVPLRDQTRETVPPTMPMHRWATLANATRGATLHSDGLAAVEAQPENGSFALTLLRAIGELSRSDLPERPGHAGWPAPVPMAQSIGRFQARVGLQLHGAWSQPTRDAIESASDALLLPLTGDTLRDLHDAESPISGPLLHGVALRCSAVTLADDGEGIVLRCVNDSLNNQIGTWTMPLGDAWECAEARLDETPTEPWRRCETTIPFTAAPRGVVTFRVRRFLE